MQNPEPSSNYSSNSLLRYRIRYLLFLQLHWQPSIITKPIPNRTVCLLPLVGREIHIRSISALTFRLPPAQRAWMRAKVPGPGPLVTRPGLTTVVPPSRSRTKWTRSEGRRRRWGALASSPWASWCSRSTLCSSLGG